MIFSWSNQCISYIDLGKENFGTLLNHYADRLLISGLLGFLAFILIDFLLNRFVPRLKISNYLNGFGIYIIYLVCQSGGLLLFFIFFALALLIGFVQTRKMFSHEKKASTIRNLLISFVIIGYFSVLPLLYFGEHDFFILARNMISLSIIALPVILMRRYIRLYLLFVILVLFVHAVPSLYHYNTYGYIMTRESYFVIMETTFDESMEFLAGNLNIQLIFMLVSFLILPFVMLFFIKNESKSVKKNWKHIAIAFIVIIASFFTNENYKYNIAYGYYENYSNYNSELRSFIQKVKTRKENNNLQGQVFDNNPDKPVNFVCIIGESTGRNHMELYGYYRNTNPILSAMKDDLYVFDDVISPHSHTRKSLRKALTFTDFENSGDNLPSIIELFNAAGFKTYWLSNQYLLGENETIVSYIAGSADEKVYINDENNLLGNSYDEYLLKPLDQFLNDGIKKRMIFVHLMGTHGDYINRYPANFEYFTEDSLVNIKTKNKPFLDSWGKEKINEYDNAVRYNDYVVSEIIRRIKETQSLSYVLYFSDHGEEVFDSRPYVSHQEPNATPFMFEVPFIVWLSDNYKNAFRSFTDSLPLYLHRPYQFDDLPHSLLNLSNIGYAETDYSKSIFSEFYKPEKRYINVEDYDIVKEKFNEFR
mgnify:CR=1 FL=1